MSPGLVGSHGHSVGSAFTLADIVIFNAFGDSLPAQENPNLPPHLREPFGSASRTQLLLRKHPKVPFASRESETWFYLFQPNRLCRLNELFATYVHIPASNPGFCGAVLRNFRRERVSKIFRRREKGAVSATTLYSIIVTHIYAI